MRSLTLVLALLLLALGSAYAQIQDCVDGAGTVCIKNFTQVNSYSGYGSINELENNSGMATSKCLQYGENNSVWYQIIIDTPGILQFTITPNGSDDYDFALFDLTNANCTDIGKDSTLEVRCNFALTQGLPTGLKTGFNDTIAGPADSAFLAPIIVQQGDRFALVIDNFTSNGGGFALDFSTTTASFANNINEILYPGSACGTDTLKFTLLKRITCTAVDTINEKFVLLDTNAPDILEAFAVDCYNGYTYHIALVLSSPLTDGDTFNLQMNLEFGDLSSGVCGNNTLTDTMTFIANSQSQVTADFSYQFSGGAVLFTNESTGASRYTWIFGDGTGSLSENPSHTYNANDCYEVCLTAMNACGITDTFCDTIRFWTCTTGINELEPFHLTLYPNPTRSQLFLEMEDAQAKTITVYNLYGQQVMHIEDVTQQQLSLNTAHLPQGSYLLQVAGEKGTTTQPFVVLP